MYTILIVFGTVFGFFILLALCFFLVNHFRLGESNETETSEENNDKTPTVKPGISLLGEKIYFFVMPRDYEERIEWLMKNNDLSRKEAEIQAALGPG